MGGLMAIGLIPKTAESQTIPEVRAHHQLVYHAGEGRTYLIGGSTRRGRMYHYFDDVWALDKIQWRPVSTLPFPRSSHRVVYHRGRNSIILFGGGFERAVKAEGVLWEWKQNEWRAVGGNVRAGRDEPGMCYDEKRERIVLFGGWDGGSSFRGDTWEWDGTELVQKDTAGPSPRAGHALLYDYRREQCLLFGGRGKEGFFNDTWVWNGAAWKKLDVQGPSARWFFGSAADPSSGRIVIFGGRGPDAPTVGRDNTGDLGDTWIWDGKEWKQLTGEGPASRGSTMAFDGENMILFGGRYETKEGFVDLNDTWVLDSTTWKRQQ